MGFAQDIFETKGSLDTPYRKLTGDYVKTIEVGGKQVLQVESEGLTLLAKQAMIDIAHLLRPGHLQQLANILKVRFKRTDAGRAKIIIHLHRTPRPPRTIALWRWSC